MLATVQVKILPSSCMPSRDGTKLLFCLLLSLIPQTTVPSPCTYYYTQRLLWNSEMFSLVNFASMAIVHNTKIILGIPKEKKATACFIENAHLG